jgi:hypothetical protein
LVEETALSGNNGYRYSITRKFLSLLERVGSNTKPDWSLVAVDMNGREAKELEGVSTILFLESRGWSGTDLANRFASLKPHLNESFSVFRQLGHELKKRISATV